MFAPGLEIYRKLKRLHAWLHKTSKIAWKNAIFVRPSQCIIWREVQLTIDRITIVTEVYWKVGFPGIVELTEARG